MAFVFHRLLSNLLQRPQHHSFVGLPLLKPLLVFDHLLRKNRRGNQQTAVTLNPWYPDIAAKKMTSCGRINRPLPCERAVRVVVCRGRAMQLLVLMLEYSSMTPHPSSPSCFVWMTLQSSFIFETFSLLSPKGANRSLEGTVERPSKEDGITSPWDFQRCYIHFVVHQDTATTSSILKSVGIPCLHQRQQCPQGNNGHYHVTPAPTMLPR